MMLEQRLKGDILGYLVRKASAFARINNDIMKTNMKDFFPASDRRGFIASTALSFAGAVTTLPFMRPAAAATAAEIGAWSQIYSWPDVAIHLHLLPNGRVLRACLKLSS